MSFKVTIGQYINGDSFIHQLDPRLKITLTFFFMILVFFASNLATNLAVAFLLLAVILISKIPVSTVLRAIKPIVPFLILTAIVNLFFIKTGDTIFSLGFLRITTDGLHSTILLTARFFFLMVGGTMLALTTSPIALTDGTESILSPFEKVGLPAHELAMMLSISLRFIPTLAIEAERIIKTQQSRGASFDEGNLIQRAKLFIPIVVPLFASSIRHAENLAVAMDARCYEGGEGRTHYRILKMGKKDALAFAIFVAFTAAFIVLKIML